jgi:hypothetical protein
MFKKKKPKAATSDETRLGLVIQSAVRAIDPPVLTAGSEEAVNESDAATRSALTAFIRQRAPERLASVV